MSLSYMQDSVEQRWYGIHGSHRLSLLQAAKELAIPMEWHVREDMPNYISVGLTGTFYECELVFRRAKDMKSATLKGGI